MNTPSSTRVANAHMNRSAAVSFEDRVLKVLRKTGWARDNASDVVTEYAVERANKGLSGPQISGQIQRDNPTIEFIDDVRDIFLEEIADILGEAGTYYNTGDVKSPGRGVFEFNIKTDGPATGDVDKVLTGVGGDNVSVAGDSIRVTFPVNLGVIALLDSGSVDRMIDEVVESGL